MTEASKSTAKIVELQRSYAKACEFACFARDDGRFADAVWWQESAAEDFRKISAAIAATGSAA